MTSSNRPSISPIHREADATGGLLSEVRPTTMRNTPALRTARRVALTLLAAAALLSHGNLARAAAKSDAKVRPPTPEVKLVDEYTTWFSGAAFAGDMDKLKADLTKYITDKTVLHEAISLPWGGTMVGYDGWVRLSKTVTPIVGKISSDLDVSDPVYYQRGRIVIREVTVTIKGTAAAPQPFAMGLIEKFTIESGRIKQIDVFFQDTAGFLDRLTVLGAIPARKP
jgi:hypothetical protein